MNEYNYPLFIEYIQFSLDFYVRVITAHTHRVGLYQYRPGSPHYHRHSRFNRSAGQPTGRANHSQLQWLAPIAGSDTAAIDTDRGQQPAPPVLGPRQGPSSPKSNWSKKKSRLWHPSVTSCGHRARLSPFGPPRTPPRDERATTPASISLASPAPSHFSPASPPPLSASRLSSRRYVRAPQFRSSRSMGNHERFCWYIGLTQGRLRVRPSRALFYAHVLGFDPIIANRQVSTDYLLDAREKTHYLSSLNCTQRERATLKNQCF